MCCAPPTSIAACPDGCAPLTCIAKYEGVSYAEYQIAATSAEGTCKRNIACGSKNRSGQASDATAMRLFTQVQRAGFARADEG
jgi:hypothetical protein